MTENLLEEEELVRHLKDFHRDSDTRHFGVLDFASAFGSPLYALVYSKLFWPDFIEFEGMIFHPAIMETDADRARVRKALSEGKSRQEVEASFNSFDIPSDFFASDRGLTTVAEHLLLANRLRDMWGLRLKELFPQRIFTVEVTSYPHEEPTLVVSEPLP